MSAQPAGPAPDFDPLDEAFAANPHPTWARLRRECPVARGAVWDFWALTRYEDIKRASRSPKSFTSSEGVTVPRNPVSGRRAPLHFDPPEHPLYRRPLNTVLSEAHIAELEPRIAALAAKLVAKLVAQGSSDAVAQLSSPLAGVTLGMLIGLDEAEALDLNKHSERFEWAQGHRQVDVAEAENLYLYGRCREIVEARSRAPADPARDIVSALLSTRVGGQPLDHEFIAGSLRQLLIAAHVAPTAALASAIRHLACDHVLQDRLRSEPARIAEAVEEFLRLYTPNQGFARTATRATTIRGRLIRPGEQVALVLTSANRDEEIFPEPDAFILGRSPNPHIAFGHGAHKCPGRQLARAEMRLGLEKLLGATDYFQLADEPRWLRWPLYGPESLPLACQAS